MVFIVHESSETSDSGSVVLTSPRAMECDIFGFSVAISGDTIVVGAPGEGLDVQGNRTFEGAAYVFTKPHGGWVSSSDATRLTAPDAPPGTWFGTSVAVSDDTVVVGAPGNRYWPWEEFPTAAYVFTKARIHRRTPMDGVRTAEEG